MTIFLKNPTKSYQILTVLSKKNIKISIKIPEIRLYPTKVGFIKNLCFLDLMKQKISITINNKILRDIDSIVDNIFIRNRSNAIEYLINRALEETRVAVILAGESRIPTPGKIRNRYLLKINHSSIIEHIIRSLKDTGFSVVYIVADHLTLTKIFKILGDGKNYDIKVEYVDEEVYEGTAKALKLLKRKLRKTFLVTYCDTLLDNIDLNELWKEHIKGKMVATIALCSSVVPEQKTPFAHVKLEGTIISSFVEKPSKKKLTSSIFSRGIMVLEPEFFKYPGNDLETEVLPELAKRRLLGGHITSVDHLHVHSHEDLVSVKKKLKAIK